MNRPHSFRIPVDDQKRAQQFYSDAFGWRLTQPEDADEASEAEMIFEADQDMIEAERERTGGVRRFREAADTEALVSVEVASVEDALARVKAAGGEVVIPKGDAADSDYDARFRDTEGNLVDIWERTRT